MAIQATHRPGSAPGCVPPAAAAVQRPAPSTCSRCAAWGERPAPSGGRSLESGKKRGKKRGTWEIPNFYGEIGLAISVGKSWEIPRLGHKNGTILYKWGTNISGPNNIGGIYGFCFGWLRAYKGLASTQRSRDKLFPPDTGSPQ